MRIFKLGISLIALALTAPAAAAPEAQDSNTAKAAPPPIQVVTVPPRVVPPPIQVVTVGPPIAPSQTKSPPNFDAMFAFIQKLFPAEPDPDPARLTLARTAVGAMWPDGTYGKMMSGLFGGMFDRAMQLRKSDLTALDPKQAKATPAADGKDPSLYDQAKAKDPYFDQRAAAIRPALNEEAGKLSAIIDPRMRDGLSRSMARRLDAHQLADVNAFFATPSGHAFASQYMQMWLAPDTMRSLMGSLPDMMKLMPEMMQKVKEADDKFPKPPKLVRTPLPPPVLPPPAKKS